MFCILWFYDMESIQKKFSNECLKEGPNEWMGRLILLSPISGPWQNIELSENKKIGSIFIKPSVYSCRITLIAIPRENFQALSSVTKCMLYQNFPLVSTHLLGGYLYILCSNFGLILIYFELFHLFHHCTTNNPMPICIF